MKLLKWYVKVIFSNFYNPEICWLCLFNYLIIFVFYVKYRILCGMTINWIIDWLIYHLHYHHHHHHRSSSSSTASFFTKCVGHLACTRYPTTNIGACPFRVSNVKALGTFQMQPCHLKWYRYTQTTRKHVKNLREG